MDYYLPFVGGIEIVTQRLAEHLAASYEVIVLTQAIENVPKDEYLHGVHIVRVWSPLRLLFPLCALWTALRYRKALYAIHTAPYSSPYLASLFRLIFRIPTVLHVHGLIRTQFRESGYGVLARLLLPYEKMIFRLPVSRIVAVSSFVAQQLHKMGVRKPITIIPNGVDYEIFFPRPRNEALRRRFGIRPDEVMLFYFGRPARTRGAQLLLQTFIEYDFPDTLRVVLALAHEPKKDYDALILSANQPRLKRRLLVCPPVEHEDLPDSIGAADMVILPSYTEGFGLAAAEVCAMEKPLIVTTRGALPETVSGKIIFIEELTTKGMAEAINKALRAEFTTIPKKSFPWSTMYAEYDRLYASLSRHEERTSGV